VKPGLRSGVRRSGRPARRPADPKVNTRGRPQPDVLARELRLVLKVGTRPAKIAYMLPRLPALARTCGDDEDVPGQFDVAIANKPCGSGGNLVSGRRPLTALLSGRSLALLVRPEDYCWLDVNTLPQRS
jgi:hypothetical protein